MWKPSDVWDQRVRAACLWLGPEAAASHRAAAALNGLAARPSFVELTTPTRRKAESLVLHETRQWLQGDVRNLGGIRTTSIPRTLLDLGSVVDSASVESAFEEALRKRRTSPGELRARLSQAGRGHDGAATLRRLLDRYPGIPTGSELELEFEKFLRRFSLPRAVRQHVITDLRGPICRADFAYPEDKIAIEIESFEWHAHRTAFDADVDKTNRLAAADWKPFPVTKRHLREEQRDLAERLGRLLGRTPLFP